MKFLSVKEVAGMLNKTPRWVVERCREGIFKEAWKSTPNPHGHWLIPHDDVISYVKSMQQAARLRSKSKSHLQSN